MQYFVPSQAIVHSDYNPLNLQHNLGILILPHLIPPFLVNPIQLPPPFLQPSPMFRYYGFGITDYVDMNSVPNTLKHGFTSEIPIQNCSSIFGGQLITENSWCAQQFTSGLCHGDQGGPLVHFFENYLIAVASFWMVPCHGGYPDVFVRIEPYIGWINNITMSDN
ncbi:chymotrypsin-2-like [Phlebotomus papatasi]|uniref:chymotrypsin-2-like n=1 Tax=Phlebotomus papatasi TaxID=29031 RepID=UPI00248345E8|nr:chymotrypsin-2-like [Phlebotomus papatasi]